VLGSTNVTADCRVRYGAYRRAVRPLPDAAGAAGQETRDLAGFEACLVQATKVFQIR
jgi:hypothetical protein